MMDESRPADDGWQTPRIPANCPGTRKRIREALTTPGRPAVRVVAKQFGVDPGTVQRISHRFDGASVAVA
jgi:hypothetical protein